MQDKVNRTLHKNVYKNVKNASIHKAEYGINKANKK